MIIYKYGVNCAGCGRNTFVVYKCDTCSWNHAVCAGCRFKLNAAGIMDFMFMRLDRCPTMSDFVVGALTEGTTCT